MQSDDTCVLAEDQAIAVHVQLRITTKETRNAERDDTGVLTEDETIVVHITDVHPIVHFELLGGAPTARVTHGDPSAV